MEDWLIAGGTPTSTWGGGSVPGRRDAMQGACLLLPSVLLPSSASPSNPYPCRAGRDGLPCCSLLYASDKEMQEAARLERGERRGAMAEVAAIVQVPAPGWGSGWVWQGLEVQQGLAIGSGRGLSRDFMGHRLGRGASRPVTPGQDCGLWPLVPQTFTRGSCRVPGAVGKPCWPTLGSGGAHAARPRRARSRATFAQTRRWGGRAVGRVGGVASGDGGRM